MATQPKQECVLTKLQYDDFNSFKQKGLSTFFVLFILTLVVLVTEDNL